MNGRAKTICLHFAGLLALVRVFNVLLVLKCHRQTLNTSVKYGRIARININIKLMKLLQFDLPRL